MLVKSGPRAASWYQCAMKKRSVLAAAASLLLLASCGQPDPPYRLRADDAEAQALGRKVYTNHCASCHGARLEGQPNWRLRDAAGRLPAPPHDASGHTWHHPDEVLFRITKHGVAKAANLKDYDSAMPAYEGVLTDAEIVAVLSWIKSQWPADVRRQHDEVNAAAAARR
ncbi:MAG: cytochrome c [Comamonadaceae bacterium]|nr:MAG: cytochrome c [Comamonadaceae bacterium]